MAKKLDLTGSFKHTSDNVKGLDNNSVSGEPIKITLNIHREWKDDFLRKMTKYFRSLDRWDINSNKDIFIVCLLNLKEQFEKKYGEILVPSDEEITFYQKQGRRNKLDYDLYPKSKITDEKMTIEIDKFYYDLLFSLTHTYFRNEMPEASNYSISFFFYDMVRMIDKMKEIKIYDV